MSLHLFGIATCDRCRRARRWLAEAGAEARWTDLRDAPVPVSTLEAWVAELGWEQLLNRRSTTWRGLDERLREIGGPGDAVALMTAHPTLIKRPVLLIDDEVTVGFGPEVMARLEAGDSP